MSQLAVYIVTFRRHEMLKRAIRSVLAQTHTDFRVCVVNDDPSDPGVGEIVRGFADPRLSLYLPLTKRGAARNFNLMFEDAQADYVCLLEDDNWWEPDFLETMVALLSAHPEVDAACCNERLWRENEDGSWLDTGRNIWPAFEPHIHRFALSDLCGSAKLCNSAMLYRKKAAGSFKTPDDIPVDVTEHFRERMFPAGFALHARPMVNYAETITTARAKGSLWGEYQILLIGSVFAAPGNRAARKALAAALWASCREATSPRAVTLVIAGLAVREARALVLNAPKRALLRACATMIRRFPAFLRAFSVTRRFQPHFEFLVHAPLTQALAREAAERSDVRLPDPGVVS
jgi:Glycosyl transferase family 2